MDGPLLHLAFEACFAEEFEEFLPKQGMERIAEFLGETVDAYKPVDVSEVMRSVPPDAAGDLEGDQGFEGVVPQPVGLNEGVGIRGWVGHRAVLRARVFARYNDIDVDGVFGLAQPLPKARATRHDPSPNLRLVDLAQSFGRRDDVDILGMPQVSVVLQGDGAHHGEGDVGFRQSPAQGLQNDTDVPGVRVVAAHLLDEGSANRFGHAGILPVPRSECNTRRPPSHAIGPQEVLIEVRAAGESIPVLVPAEFNHLDIRKEGRFQFKVEIVDKGIVKARDVRKE